MRGKRRSSHPGGPRMRPPDPDVDAKISAGTEVGMSATGYDYPVRKVRRSKGSVCVTLPLQVRAFLALEGGDWLMFGEPSWPGLAGFFRVTAKRQEALTADERKEFRHFGRKVRSGNGGMVVAIPQVIRKILSAEVGDCLIFGISPRLGSVTVAAIKGGGESTGSRRTG